MVFRADETGGAAVEADQREDWLYEGKEMMDDMFPALARAKSIALVGGVGRLGIRTGRRARRGNDDGMMDG